MVMASINDEGSDIKVDFSSELLKADSIVDGVVTCAKEIQEATLEMVRQFDDELTGQIPSLLSNGMKDAFIEETLQIVSDQINTEGYNNYVLRKQ